MNVTERLFKKTLFNESGTVATYLKGLDALDVTAKTAHDDALDKFTNAANKITINNNTIFIYQLNIISYEKNISSCSSMCDEHARKRTDF